MFQFFFIPTQSMVNVTRRDAVLKLKQGDTVTEYPMHQYEVIIPAQSENNVFVVYRMQEDGSWINGIDYPANAEQKIFEEIKNKINASEY